MSCLRSSMSCAGMRTISVRSTMTAPWLSSETGTRLSAMTALRRTMMDYLHEMARLMVEDAWDDPNMVYTKEAVDRRLRKICGEKFEPWEVRYK